MFIDSFIGYLRVERLYSSHTLRAYERDLLAFKDYVARLDESLLFYEADTDVVRSWVASMMDAGAASSTVCRKLSTLRSFFAFVRANYGVAQNPVASLKGPKCRKKLPSFVKEDDMNRLIDDVAFGDGYVACRDKMILQLFYETGMRLSELVGLDLSSLDMQACVVKVLGKRNRERIIPFAAGLKAALEHYLGEREAFAPRLCNALFLSSKGERIAPGAVYRMVRTRLNDVTSVKKKSPHVLRHSFATAMLNNNAEIGAVKELLGHRRLATTEIYTHLSFEDLKGFYEKAHPRAGK
ncbi:MAG: tyrosine-type recombinase/integrase [Bacteroidaceae bacterium]|nr:tyrosine-type recombinase/integrase [Bacteroidaceae bacterium]